uniref:Uncharacterized protein n=1 Tax=Heliothis virescens TaxID=7102 RepID=A0A2A4K9D1_HELVI
MIMMLSVDEQYYSMPRLFSLDEWAGCVAARGAYCLGSFELEPAQRPHPLYDLMEVNASIISILPSTSIVTENHEKQQTLRPSSNNDDDTQPGYGVL